VSDETKVFDEAFRQWGAPAELDMCKEECAELIVALCHLLRDGHITSQNRAVQLSHVAEELADVSITCAQVTHILGIGPMVEGFRKGKMARLRDRLGMPKED